MVSNFMSLQIAEGKTKNVRNFIIGESSGQKQVKTSLLQNKAERENRETQEINVSEGQKV